jgi:DNA-binding NtrC family response regulator
MTGHERHSVYREPELPGGRIECVFLTCFRPEFSSLATILQYSGVRMLRADSLDEADFLLTVTGGTAFLSDVTFPEGTWRDALHMAAEMHPRVPSLIVADPVDWPFLSDAFERGACGVLWKPFDSTQALEMILVLHQAARDRAVWLAESSAAQVTGEGSRRLLRR